MRRVYQEYPTIHHNSRIKYNKSINTETSRLNNKNPSRTKLEKLEKANERFKKTFFKQDIFNKIKKNDDKGYKLLEMGQFNDQEIFNYNNSIADLSRLTTPLKQQSHTLKITKNNTSLRHKLLILWILVLW